MDRFQLLFLGGSGLLMLVQSIRGWRVGVIRQLVSFAALALAYLAAIAFGRFATPLLHPLGYPDLLVSVLAGSVFGGVVYLAITIAGAILCQRTDQHTLGLARLGYGAGGSFLGFASALATVWLSVMAIRFLGTVAEAEVNMAKTPAARHDGMMVSPMAAELAQFKESLDSGPAGPMLDETDPIPDRVYLILKKITAVIFNVDAMQRFAKFPGTKTLTENPRIIALQRDPGIAQEVQRRDFVALLGNRKLVDAMNDPALEEIVRGFDLEKALDYALDGKGPGGKN
jgi:hypothetical protein